MLNEKEPDIVPGESVIRRNYIVIIVMYCAPCSLMPLNKSATFSPDCSSSSKESFFLSLTFVHPCIFVLYHRQLVDLSKLLKDGLQVLLLQVSGDLPDEELDCVRLLH